VDDRVLQLVEQARALRVSTWSTDPIWVKVPAADLGRGRVIRKAVGADPMPTM